MATPMPASTKAPAQVQNEIPSPGAGCATGCPQRWGSDPRRALPERLHHSDSPMALEGLGKLQCSRDVAPKKTGHDSLAASQTVITASTGWFRHPSKGGHTRLLRVQGCLAYGGMCLDATRSSAAQCRKAQCATPLLPTPVSANQDAVSSLGCSRPARRSVVGSRVDDYAICVCPQQEIAAFLSLSLTRLRLRPTRCIGTERRGGEGRWPPVAGTSRVRYTASI